MTHTPTLPLDDKAMWRKIKSRVHPDIGGSHEEFIWIQAVEEAISEHRPPRPEPPPKPGPRMQEEPSRVPFPKPADFEALTARALTITDEVLPLYADLLRMLEDCEPVDHEPLRDQQGRGATYKQLAAIGHEAGMSKAQRGQWYRIAEGVPLSCRHAGHILSRLKKGRAA